MKSLTKKKDKYKRASAGRKKRFHKHRGKDTGLSSKKQSSPEASSAGPTAPNHHDEDLFSSADYDQLNQSTAGGAGGESCVDDESNTKRSTSEPIATPLSTDQIAMLSGDGLVVLRDGMKWSPKDVGGDAFDDDGIVATDVEVDIDRDDIGHHRVVPIEAPDDDDDDDDDDEDAKENPLRFSSITADMPYDVEEDVCLLGAAAAADGDGDGPLNYQSSLYASSGVPEDAHHPPEPLGVYHLDEGADELCGAEHAQDISHAWELMESALGDVSSMRMRSLASWSIGEVSRSALSKREEECIVAFSDASDTLSLGEDLKDSLSMVFDHPNVPVVANAIGACARAPAPFIAYTRPAAHMEPLASMVLRKEPSPSWYTRMAIGLRVAHALDGLHAHSIPHGDVCPQCVWTHVAMSEEDVPNVCLVGAGVGFLSLPKLPSADAEHWEHVLHIAPELLLHPHDGDGGGAGADASIAADVYSYGLLLWSLSTWKPLSSMLPTHQRSAGGFASFVASKRLPIVPEANPTSLKVLLKQCLDPEPSKRPSASLEERCAEAMVDGIIRDRFARTFWKRHFLPRISVGWNEFQSALMEEYHILGAHSSMWSCLALLMTGSKDTKNVSLKQYGFLVSWFGPGDKEMVQRAFEVLGKDYFYGSMSSVDAEAALRASLMDGAYLLRFSSTGKVGTFTLSVIRKAKVVHVRVSRTKELTGYVCGNTTYDSLDSLVWKGSRTLGFSIACPGSPFALIRQCSIDDDDGVVGSRALDGTYCVEMEHEMDGASPSSSMDPEIALVSKILEDMGLHKYVGVFEEQEITFEVFCSLSEEDLKELHIPLGPRRRLAAAIRKHVYSSESCGELVGADDEAAAHSHGGHRHPSRRGGDGGEVSMDDLPITDEMRRKYVIDGAEIEFLHVISKGNYGVVHKAKWRGALCAVKKSKAAMESMKQLSEFYQEASVLLNMQPHVNIVQVYGICEDRSNMCLVMEYLPHGDLATKIRQERFSLEHKARFMLGIAAGMAHLHREGIIHRDLAARNILLAASGHVKVTDFGMSKKGMYQSTSGFGALKWMAPEALNPEHSKFSTWSDVWSFGVVCWEILHEREPYDGLTPKQAGTAVLLANKRLQFDHDVPESFVRVIRPCWNEEPSERPSMIQLCERLEELCDAMAEVV